MAKLTGERDTPEIAGGARQLVLRVKGAATIYQGSLVALDGSGYAVPASKAAGLTAAGRAEETVENRGSDGAASIRISRGVFVFANSAAEDSRVTAAHLLHPCYIEDDQTVSSLSEGSSPAGIVVRVDEAGVAVSVGGGTAI